MRIIRTEMYFDTKLVEGISRIKLDNPGVAIAWFAEEGREPDVHAIIDQNWQQYELSEMEAFVAAALTEFQELPTFQPLPGVVYMRSTAESFAQYILQQSVVIEHSPPEGIPFASLLKKASGAFIGTYIGTEIAADNHLLLLITVPGGIMLVSSAIGISKALEKGFNKIVSRAFHSKK